MVGVDISTKRVKILQLARSESRRHRVEAYASEALPSDAIRDFQIHNAPAVARAIEGALAKSGTRSRQAAIAVSGPDVISKTILLPAAMDEIEMEQQIQFDALHYVAHSSRDVHIDFQVLEPDPRDTSFNRVLVVACRRETIETYCGALEMAGMKVRLVDVEEYALQNACALLDSHRPEHGPHQSLAVFDVGALDTRLTIQNGPRSRYTRSVHFGGSMLAAQLVAKHNLSDIEELHTRLRIGELASEAIAEDIEAFASDLAVHIERTLNFYLSAASDSRERIERVVVTGGVARYQGLAQALQGHLPWPVALGDPLAGMSASALAKRNHIETDAPSLMVAAGLALRSVS